MTAGPRSPQRSGAGHRLRRSRRALSVVAGLLLLILLPLGGSHDRSGASLTFTVNSTSDAADAVVGDGQCGTGSTVSGGATECTLRAALQEANATPDADTITFTIPTTDPNHGSGVWTITPLTALPTLHTPMTINGTTQAGTIVNTQQSPGALTGNLAIQISGTADSVTSDWDALVLLAGSDGTTIRGLSITGFDNASSDAILIWGSSGNVIAGNYFGIAPDGTTATSGNKAGVGVGGGGIGNRIGGTAPADRNVFALNTATNNEWAAVWAMDAATTGTLVQGNDFGLLVGGAAAPPGGYTAVQTFDGAAMTVGGTATGAGNRITGFSVGIVANAGTANSRIAIVGNRIWGNGALGIDLGDNGVSANDPNDVDSGPNDLLNFPLIASVKVAGSIATVAFTLDVPAGSYRVEAFTNPSGADGSGYGEAQLPAGAATVTSAGSGTESFELTYTGAVGDVVTMTATRIVSGTFDVTSELSPAVTAVNRVVTVNSTSGSTSNDTSAGNHLCTTSFTNSAGAPACTIRAALQEANASANIDTIWFALPTSEAGYSGGVWTTTPLSALPGLSTTLTIDATTQAGYATTPVVVLAGTSLPSGPGLSVTASGVTVRGLVVQSVPGVGISVAGARATVEHCHIGTNAAGTSAAANAGNGIHLTGADAVIRSNLVSGNGDNGVLIGPGGHRAVLTDNFIGTTVTGNAALANAQEGIEVTAANDVVIGQVGHGNVISGNLYAGINAWLTGSTGVQVQANKIGVGANGTSALGNGAANSEGGITLRSASSGWLIGGPAVGEGNTIAHNTGDGVALSPVNGVSNDIAVLGNSIHSNTGLGIDLDDNGVTVNDPNDVDGGSNDLLNAPVIAEVGTTDGTVIVTYRLDAAAGTYRVEVFTSTAADPTGYGEAETAAGSAAVTHPGGSASYAISFTGTAGAIVTATLTEQPSAGTWGATSEHSLAVTAGITLSGTVQEDLDGDGAINDDGSGRPGVDVWLWKETDGNARPSEGDVVVDTTVTDAAGAYLLTAPADTTYYVTVDGRDINPSTGFAPGHGAGSALAEQTYGPTGTGSFDGAVWSWAATAAARFGGARAATTDGFARLSTADHVARVEAGTSSVSGLDWGFSFVPVVNTLDAQPTAGYGSAAAWSAYDPGTNGVGNDPDGFFGAVFDGRYIYFVPHHNGTGYTGEVLRLDTTAPFGTPSAWSTYDPGAMGVGADADGYAGAVFDGRFVYFVPHHNGTDYHGEVLRLDTAASFTSPSSWATFDPGANGVGIDPDGYLGAAFDGRYLYFAPNNDTGGRHGEVLRYDTTATFADAASWSTFDPGANGVGTDPDGFTDAVFDGRYVYLVPYDNGTARSGEVLRYDTTVSFDQASSWTAYDPGANGVGADPDGFRNAVFDGRYLYFIQQNNGTANAGEMLRFDTTATFDSPSSWTAFDPGANGVGTDPDGYMAAAFDGRFLYLAQQHNGSGYSGEMLRYDTAASFTSSASWTTFDPGASGVGVDADGYRGIVYDGRFVYFVPDHNGSSQHGEVLRYDTGRQGQGSLRRFLTNASVTAGTQSANFELPAGDPGYSGGVWTLDPVTTLELDSTVVLDATTQAPWSGSPVVSIRGTSLASGPGVTVSGAGAVLIGLSIRDVPGVGVVVSGAGATVSYCFVGTDPAGTAAAANTAQGVVATAEDLTLSHNLISGNGVEGLRLDGAHRALVTDNLIGTDVTGNVALGNAHEGIEVNDSDDIQIGIPDHGNVIAANGFSGINAWTGASSGGMVQGNRIGVGANGTTALGNGLNQGWGGITFHSDSTAWLIGGTGAGEGNTIAHNTGPGVGLATTNGVPNDIAVLGNTIHATTGPSIDLGADGPTANDPGDGDSGPNDQLNAPVPVAAIAHGSQVELSLAVDVPAGPYRLEVWTDPGDAAELRTLVHSARFTAIGGSQNLLVTVAASEGDRLVATLTEDDGATTGSTSEVGAASVVVAPVAWAFDSGPRRTDLEASAGVDLGAASAGVAGAGVDLDGGTDRLIGPATDVTSDALTLSAWVRLDTPGTDPRVVAKAAANGSPIYELLVDDGTGHAVARLTTSTGTAEVRGGTVAPGPWRFLATTWDGANLRLYVDGALVDSAAANGTLISDLTVPLVVGNLVAADRGLDGALDQVQVAHTARSASWLETVDNNLRQPEAFVTLGAVQTDAAAPWSTTTAQFRTGSGSLQAPLVADNGADAWLTAVGIDEPGLEFESWWRVSTTGGSHVLAAGTRTGAVPVDQYETALTSTGFDLAHLLGATRAPAAPPGGGLSPPAWTRVVVRTDETGTTSVTVDGATVAGPVTLSGGGLGGSAGFRVGTLEAPATWHVDDVQLRRLVSDEPTTAVGPLDRN